MPYGRWVLHLKLEPKLLHMPLEPEIANLAEPHRRFVAGRSMRDVEPNVTLKVRDPHGNTIANADDLS